MNVIFFFFFFFQAEDGIRDTSVTGVQTCALPINETKSDLDAAVAQLAHSEYASEAAPLEHEWAAQPAKRGAGARRLGEILPAVLVKLGVSLVQSPTSGGMTSSVPEPEVGGPDNAVSD